MSFFATKLYISLFKKFYLSLPVYDTDTSNWPCCNQTLASCIRGRAATKPGLVPFEMNEYEVRKEI